MMKTTMGVKLDDETQTRLKTLGVQKERSPHWLMKRAIQEFLDREEAYEREKIEDLQRWQLYVDTGKHISHEEMQTRLKRLAAEARGKSAAAK